jgi:hypothetical protein
MGIFYGDIHYGIRISKEVENKDCIFTELIYELKFEDNSILLNDYLDKIKNIYLKLLESDKYRYELLVDVFTTYNDIKNNKTWQIITKEQMINFINGIYKIHYLD